MFSIEAVDRIKQHNKKDPLFLYLSYQGVHSANLIEDPLQAPQKWINKFRHIKNQGRRKYAAMVAAMDDGIGKVSDLKWFSELYSLGQTVCLRDV